MILYLRHFLLLISAMYVSHYCPRLLVPWISWNVLSLLVSQMAVFYAPNKVTARLGMFAVCPGHDDHPRLVLHRHLCVLYPLCGLLLPGTSSLLLTSHISPPPGADCPPPLLLLLPIFTFLHMAGMWQERYFAFSSFDAAPTEYSTSIT